MRTVGWGLAALGCVLAAGGCRNQALLVRDPPAPYFGPRTAGRTAPSAAPSAEAARSAAAVPRTASWSEGAWDIRGAQRPWRFIVLHHSATPRGSAAEFDRLHRANGWDELGYHFVIGNGTGSGDGEVEVGSRWPKQKHGAHCKVTGHPEYNDVGIGICLVGNFNETRPTEAQMAGLARLVRFLMTRYGIPRGRIFGHGQLKPTDCPGRNFDYGGLFRRL